MTTTAENLGPAEQIIQTLLQYTDHMVHNRPGMVVQDRTSKVGVTWSPVTHKVEGEAKNVYKLTKVGKKTSKIKVGALDTTTFAAGHANRILGAANAVVGFYRPAGLFPEVAEWMYKQVAAVWKLDNEFSARWASYAFGQEHRDLKVVLAAFMLVQARKGDPVIDAGKIAFHDEDYRDVGEAMLLLTKKDGKDFNPKLLLRIRELLQLPQVAAVNRELGFGRSPTRPFLGRWEKAVEKWLRYREENPKMLEGLVKAGFRTTVMELAQAIGYKPTSPKFFAVLRWKQAQAKDGRRELAIGAAVKAADLWDGLTEKQICERIIKEKPNYKRLVGLVPAKGITRAVMAAAIEAGSLSDKDLIMATPTLEELGLLEVQDVKARWEKALKNADDTRAANIALRVKSTAVAEKLQEGADTAVKKAVEKAMKGLVIYVIIDISGSMEGAIEGAKVLLAKFLQGFPADKIHVAVFNTTGRKVEIKHQSAAGVEQAFRGIRAGGGTDYGAGVRVLQDVKPGADEDAIFLFVGDEEAETFEEAVRQSGLNPLAFGFLRTKPVTGAAGWRAANFAEPAAVRLTAQVLGLPCFMIEEKTFDDVYAIPRTIQALVAATPVSQVLRAEPPVFKRVTLVEEILKTQLLVKPAWAA